MNTCKTCKFWDLPTDGSTGIYDDAARFCDCPKLIADVDKHRAGQDTLQVVTDIGRPSIETGPDFGCIHHEPR